MIHIARIHVRPRPKPRPRGGKGRFYMPKSFQDWRTEMVEGIQDAGFPKFEEPVDLKVRYNTDSTDIQVSEMAGHQRAVHVRADIDNLCGGTLEARQDAEVLENDSQVVILRAIITHRGDE